MTSWARLTKPTISIHALRVEGDCGYRLWRARIPNFYPRPPGGGRLGKVLITSKSYSFLSTPSGWRATSSLLIYQKQIKQFLSTPSGWRATSGPASPTIAEPCISIHALRVEGDTCTCSPRSCRGISIHALRVEGDAYMDDDARIL